MRAFLFAVLSDILGHFLDTWAPSWGYFLGHYESFLNIVQLSKRKGQLKNVFIEMDQGSTNICNIKKACAVGNLIEE